MGLIAYWPSRGVTMQQIKWQHRVTRTYNQKPGGPIRDEIVGYQNLRSMGSARAKTDTVRRHKPPLPLLNPTSHRGVKASIAISDAHVRFDNWYWGQITDTTHSVGPATGLWSDAQLGEHGLEGFFEGMALRSQTSDMAALRNKALLELSDRKIDLATLLGEARTTMQWFGNRVETLARALRALKRGRVKDFVDAVNDTPPGDRPRWVKDLARHNPSRSPRPVPTTKSPFGGNVADRWMEYNYAVMPVLYDVVGGAQALAQMMSDLPMYGYQQIRVKSKANHAFTHSEPGRNGLNARFDLHWDVFAVWTGTIEFWYRVDLQALKRAAEFGLVTPSVAWELVPWSFVIDMVIPIGDFIEACSASFGCSFESGWERERINATSMLFAMEPRSSQYVVEKKPTGFYSVIGHDRRKLYGFPAPQLYVKNPLSLRNGATIAAILRQLF